MISYISGVLAEIEDKYIVVEAGGVGYGICVPASMPYKLPGIGSAVKIYTHLSVSEDSQKLYGFISAEEREIFRLLIGVNGVGPKAGIAVLSVLSPDELKLAVMSEDEKAIARAQGLGAKTAKKIILELKDKFKLADFGGLGDASIGGVSKGRGADLGSAPGASASAREDAIGAMMALGYSASEALGAITKVEGAGDMDADELLSAALKKLI